MNRPLLCFCLALVSLASQAGDGVQAAQKVAAALWPSAKITAVNGPAPCDSELVADTPNPARNGLTQIRVRCSGTPGWTRYIALRVEQSAVVAVLRSPLAQGQPLTADLIEWQSRDALRLSADVITQSTATVLDKLTARRNVPAGSVLTTSQFMAPQAIQRGQSVMLFTHAAGMEVRAPGEALADAALGARVKVRNKTSQRIVEGVARADGTVEVQL